jgi:hypothetical protein
VRIIFISKTSYSDDTIRNNLRNISEKDSIVFFYSYSSAEEFIDNNITSGQIALDIIITENNVDNENAEEFLSRIRDDKRRTYSNRDFNFSSLPVLLIAGKEENINAYADFGFADVINDIGMDNLSNYTKNIIKVVQSWRRNVLDELENLGIKFNAGKIDYSHYLLDKKRKLLDTQILSNNFKILPRKLNYQWLIFNERQIERAIDLYIKEMKRAHRLQKKEEKRFHKLFNKYPFFLERDNYSKHWYEARLHYAEKKYWEPDYSLLPNFNQKTDLNILEVKLPTDHFLKKTDFHPKPYSKIIDHIFQVNDYKEYLESEEYIDAIENVFGFVPNSVEYTMLIGRSEDRNENSYIFNKRMKEIGSHINFLTYDDLLDYQVKYLNRMKILEIR